MKKLLSILFLIICGFIIFGCTHNIAGIEKGYGYIQWSLFYDIDMPFSSTFRDTMDVTDIEMLEDNKIKVIAKTYSRDIKMIININRFGKIFCNFDIIVINIDNNETILKASGGMTSGGEFNYKKNKDGFVTGIKIISDNVRMKIKKVYNDRLMDIGIKYSIVGHSLKFRFMKSLIEWGNSTIIAE